MAILYINTGTSPNKGDGDSLRTSFNKINQNFVYLANNAASTSSLGMIRVGNNLTITPDGTLNAENGNYTLPTATTSTLGGVKVDGVTVTINNGVISTIGSGTANTGDIIFTATTITAPADSSIRIVSTDTIYNRALVDLDPVYGNVSLQAWSSENTRSDTNAWATGTWEINIYGNPYMSFTEAYDLAYWITNTLQNSDPDTVSYSINEGSYIAWDGGSSADPSTGFVEIYTSGVNPPGNTTTNITSLAWKYRFNSRFEVGYNNGVNLDSGDQYIGINAGSYIQMYAKGSIDIDNSNAPGSDIEINSGDDIWIRGKDRATSDSEGGDINIEAGDGGNADLGDAGGGGGDVIIIAGRGGDASSAYMGGNGGIVQIYSGDGGAANAANNQPANNGGSLELQAGTAGFNIFNPALGAVGGNVEIRAGNSSNYASNGGNIILRPGTNDAGTSTVAGYVQIEVPFSSGAAGGSWYFEGDGQTLRLPNGGTLGPEGMGWVGLSNGTAEIPVSIVNKKASGSYLADITLTAGDGISGEIAFNIWNTQTFSVKTLILDSFANLSVPGIIYNSDTSNVGQLLLAGDVGEPATYLALPSDVGSTSMNVRLVNSFGDIQLSAGTSTWLFNNTGDLELPGGSVLATGGYDVALIAGNDGTSTFGTVTISTQYPPDLTGRNWQFNSLGEFYLPLGGAIQETIVTNELWGTTTTSLTLVPAGAANGTQRLEIYSTGGGEGNHIHITSGDQTQTDLFLGNDTQYFSVGAMGEMEVRARLDNNVLIKTSETVVTNNLYTNITDFVTDIDPGLGFVINGWSQRNETEIELDLFVPGLGSFYTFLTGLALGRTVVVTYSTVSGNQTFTSTVSQIFSAIAQFDPVTGWQRISGRILGTLPVDQTGIISVNFPVTTTPQYDWIFGSNGDTIFPIGSDVIFDSSGTSYVYGLSDIEFADGSKPLRRVDIIPVSSTSTGTVNQVAFTGTDMYVCIAPDYWIKFSGIIF